MNKIFYKLTPTYKEFVILDMFEKNKNITQRKISDFIGISVSMVNSYIDNLEKKLFIKRRHHSSKKKEYLITKKGVERKKLLNILYLKESRKIFKIASENVIILLNKIIKKGFKEIFLYGAGEVSEILLQTLLAEKDYPVKVIGLIDDDPSKINTNILGIRIYSIDEINKKKHDAILISSYTNRKILRKKLMNIKYDQTKIINFFDK